MKNTRCSKGSSWMDSPSIATSYQSHVEILECQAAPHSGRQSHCQWMSLVNPHPNTEGGTITTTRVTPRVRKNQAKGQTHSILARDGQCNRQSHPQLSEMSRPLTFKCKKTNHPETKTIATIPGNGSWSVQICWKKLFDHSWLPYWLAGHYFHGPWHNFWPSDHSHQVIFLPHRNTRDSMVWWRSPISIQEI